MITVLLMHMNSHMYTRTDCGITKTCAETGKDRKIIRTKLNALSFFKHQNYYKNIQHLKT